MNSVITNKVKDLEAKHKDLEKKHKEHEKNIHNIIRYVNAIPTDNSNRNSNSDKNNKKNDIIVGKL
jgi:hypothetical protein